MLQGKNGNQYATIAATTSMKGFLFVDDWWIMHVETKNDNIFWKTSYFPVIHPAPTSTADSLLDYL